MSGEPPDAESSEHATGKRNERRGLDVIRERVGDTAKIPETPNGYESPYLYVRYHSQPNMYALDLILFVLGIGAFLAFGKVFSDFRIVFDPSRYSILVTVTATVLTFVVHELIHAAVAKYVGADVSFGFGMSVINTWVDHTFQSRAETVAIALAPSVIITLAIPPILLLGSPTVSVAALVVLFVNTVGLRHDLHLVWQMFLLPSGALIYNLDEITLVYESESESGDPNSAV